MPAAQPRHVCAQAARERERLEQLGDAPLALKARFIFGAFGNFELGALGALLLLRALLNVRRLLIRHLLISATSCIIVSLSSVETISSYATFKANISISPEKPEPSIRKSVRECT